MSYGFRRDVYLPFANLASLLEEFRSRTDNTFVHFGLECTTRNGQVRVHITQPEARRGQQKRLISPGSACKIRSHLLLQQFVICITLSH
jgi:hypothetical protein